VFACRLWRILLLVKGTAPAVLLAAMAVSEAVIISRVGTISSRFYQAFVDNQRSAVAHLMLWSGGCYAATTLFFTMKSGLQDFLAWRWRAALTLHLQQLYCSNLAFYSLQVKAAVATADVIENAAATCQLLLSATAWRVGLQALSN
jgi:ABC-type uncharacterized transport system fused permease/ATPase subunit